jgi:uncharacterized protein (DUF952 family)
MDGLLTKTKEQEFKRRRAQSKNFGAKVIDNQARFIHLSQHQAVQWFDV